MFGVALFACGDAKRYTTSVELTRVHKFGQDPKAPSSIDIEMVYTSCPGDTRRLLRGGKDFASCAMKFAEGETVNIQILHSYNFDRGNYQAQIEKVGDCVIKMDLKDEANFESVERCRELKASGNTVGVHCDRQRDAEMIAKCPWLRRR